MTTAQRLIADYVARIERARVYETAIETRLDHAARLSRRLGSDSSRAVFTTREGSKRLP
jgi:hypothetical protein